MTIRLSWPSQASKSLTAIEIYRKVGHSATIDVNNPGTPYATLAGSATQFVEDVANLTEKTVYSYWVAAVKDTERLFSAPIVQGFYLDTGPGPQKLLMGDWYAGYFGYLTPNEFATRADLLADAGGLTTAQRNLLRYEPTGWYKFVFKGRILFFPANRTGYDNYTTIYQAGMAFGIDGVGEFTPNNVAGVAQTAKYTKNGYTYRVRLPYYKDYDTTGSTTDYDSGEWRNTFARLFGTAYNYGAGTLDQGKFAAIPVLSTDSVPSGVGTSALAPMFTAAYAMYSYGFNPTSITYTSYNNTFSAFFVFELVLP